MSIAVLMDNARTAVAAAQYTGVHVPALFISHADYAVVLETKRHEIARGVPIRVLRVKVMARDGLAAGTVQLADESELV